MPSNAGGMGRRGWRVLESIQAVDGLYCVDLFIDAAGDHGWAHFRTDPEDGGAWTLLTRSAEGFSSMADARTDAAETIRWL